MSNKQLLLFYKDSYCGRQKKERKLLLARLARPVVGKVRGGFVLPEVQVNIQCLYNITLTHHNQFLRDYCTRPGVIKNSAAA